MTLESDTFQKVLGRVRELEQTKKREFRGSGKEGITVIWDPDREDTAVFDRGKWTITVGPESGKYDAAKTEANPEGEGTSDPAEQTVHEFGHAEKRLELGVWEYDSRFRSEIRDPEDPDWKWKSQAEKHSCELGNEFRKEKREKEGDPDAYVDRVRYRTRTERTVIGDKIYYKGHRMNGLMRVPAHIRAAYEQDWGDEEE